MNIKEVIDKCETIAVRIDPIAQLWFETGDSQFESAYYDMLRQYSQLVRLIPANHLENLRSNLPDEIHKYEKLADKQYDSDDIRGVMAKLLSLNDQYDTIGGNSVIS